MQDIFFNSWSGIARVLMVGVLAYAALLALLRFSGKRTLSKMNAFDLVVTVALGSTLATILLGKDVALAEGLAAFVLLIGLQFVITWLSVRSDAVSGAVKSEPSLLFLRGEFLDGALRSERVSRAEIDSAIRQQGLGSMAEVAAVVLETDGSMSVISNASKGSGSLTAVPGAPRRS